MSLWSKSGIKCSVNVCDAVDWITGREYGQRKAVWLIFKDTFPVVELMIKTTTVLTFAVHQNVVLLFSISYLLRVHKGCINDVSLYNSTGAQPRLKSWGAPSFGSQYQIPVHEYNSPGWGWVREGTTMLISGFPRTCRLYPSKQQACQFLFFCHGCAHGC